MIQTEHVLKSLQIYTYIYTKCVEDVKTINEKKKVMNLKRSKEGYLGGIGRRKENGKMVYHYFKKFK